MQQKKKIINNEQLFCIYGFINRRVRGVFELLSHLKPNRNSSGQCEYMGMSAGWSWKEQPQTNPHQRNRRRYTEWQSHPAASPGSHAPHWSNDGLIKKGSGGGGGRRLVCFAWQGEQALLQDSHSFPAPKSIGAVRPLDQLTTSAAAAARARATHST